MDYTPKGYCTKEDVAAYLGITLTGDQETQVDNYIAIVEEYIERTTNRVFKADTAFSDRYFSGYSNGALAIDEAVAINPTNGVLVYDENGSLVYTMSTTDFDVYPFNKTPIRRLLMKPMATPYFYNSQRNIKISGKWGYSVEPPKGIAFATMVLAAGMLNNSIDTSGEVASERIGEYSVTYKTTSQNDDFKTAKSSIGSYTRYYV